MNRDLSKFESPKTEPDGLTKELFGCKCPSKASKKETKMSKELVEIVRCKNCIHRPIKGEDVEYAVHQALKRMGRYDLLPSCERK